MNSLSTRLSISLFTIFFLLPLSGCFSAKQNYQDAVVGADQAIYEQKSGILKPLTKGETIRGTHFLTTDDNEVIILESKFFDLNLAKYLYKKVEVRGPFIVGQKDQKDLLQVEQITVLDETPSGLTPQNIWQSYNNVGLGFSIQYKGIFQPQEEPDQVRFVPIEEVKDNQTNFFETMTVSVVSNSQKQSLENWLKTSKKIAPAQQILSELGDQHTKAIKVISTDNLMVDFYMARDTLIYQFNHTSDGGEHYDDYRNIFYEMAHSFQFTGEKTPVLTSEVTSPAATSSGVSAQTKNEPAPKPNTTKNPPTTVSPEPQVNTQKETETIETASTKETKVLEDEVATMSEDYQKVTAYIQSNITNIAPESSDSKRWQSTQFEFAKPNYVYVEYNNGTDKRKLLLQYELGGDTVKTTIIGYFKPGSDKDWETVYGNNPTAAKSREVVSVTETGLVAKQSEVQAGYRQLVSKQGNFQIQYPTNWYYSGSNNQYEFTDKIDNPALITVVLLGKSESLPTGQSLTIGDKTGVKVMEGEIVSIYLKTSSGKLYKLTGGGQYNAIMETMGGTIGE